MTVGIVGLGLIGGSLSKAYKAAGDTVYGFDRDAKVMALATADAAVDAALSQDTVCRCELIFVALYPHAAIAWLKEMAPYIAKTAVVIDACGVKQEVCQEGMELARRFGFLFVGGHPMAGTHRSGYAASRADLFAGASMVVVPPVFDDMALLVRIKALLAPMKLGHIKVCTAKVHDEMIAYTSQMPHIVSNAFVKSPYYENHEGFSGGSFRDFTRVAELNEHMWAELCLYNREVLMDELLRLQAHLEDYRTALEARDQGALESLFREGSERKTGKKQEQ
mgnify:CR=1 FL=1